MNEKLNALTEPLADDAPELTEDFFSRANLYNGNTLIRQGTSFPKSEPTTASTTLCLDADILAYFQASGENWQNRINHALKEWIATQRP